MSIIHGLHFNNLRGDIYGGLTAAVVALPLALAMGVTSGAGPIAGIYGAIFVGLFAALFGGTPAQVSGPTGPMTVVMAAMFTHYTAMFPDNPQYSAALAFTVVIMGGGVQVLMGVLKLGKYINLIPHPVISGFMSGIGVIIILLQIGPLLGYEALPGPLQSAKAIPQEIGHPVLEDLVIGGFAMAVVYLMPPRFNRILPSPLVALIIGTLGLYLWHGGEIRETMVNGHAVFLLGEASVLGDIPSGIPTPMMPAFEMGLFAAMLKSALVLGALGAIDSLLTSLVADNMTRDYHDSDRELIGQGIGNAVAGLFGGLPGAGATMRTVVNVRAGGRTPLSGALHAVVLLGIVMGAGVVARFIPHALLAGILVKVGTDIIDWDYLKRVRSAPRAGVITMFTVLFITVFVDLITAVAVGMIMAAFVFMQRMVELQLGSISVIDGRESVANLSPGEAELMARANGRILIYQVTGPLSFGAAKGMVRRMARFDQYDVLIMDLGQVTQIDFTAGRALEEIAVSAMDARREVFLVGCRPAIEASLRKQGVVKRLKDGRVMARREEALGEALALIEGGSQPTAA